MSHPPAGGPTPKRFFALHSVQARFGDQLAVAHGLVSKPRSETEVAEEAQESAPPTSEANVDSNDPRAALRMEAEERAKSLLNMRLIIIPGGDTPDLTALIQSQEASAALKTQRMMAVFDPKTLSGGWVRHHCIVIGPAAGGEGACGDQPASGKG